MTHTLNPDKWIELYGDYMFSYAKSRVSDALIAEDLIQETFLSALKAKDNFEGKASEKTWLISILKNKIIDHYRKTGLKDAEGNNIPGKKQVRLDNFFIDGRWVESSKPREWNLDVNQSLESKEFLAIFNNCINNLNGKGAIAFKMKYIEQEESPDICKALNITSPNYWVLIHRAKIQLKNCLDKNWFKEINNA